MGHSRFFMLLLVSSLLFLSFGYGFGRVALMETVEHRQHSTTGTVEHARKMRIMFEIMDYEETKPNTNPRNGYVSTPSSPIPSPLPLA